jgi:hypothetical protein
MNLRVIKVIDAPWLEIIDETVAFSTASAEWLLRNHRCRSDSPRLTHSLSPQRFFPPPVPKCRVRRTSFFRFAPLSQIRGVSSSRQA